MSDLRTSTDQPLPNSHSADEIDLKELVMVLWSGKWLISAVTAIVAIASAVIALSLPNIYTASALLVPAERGSNGLSGVMGEYGGLARLAGVSLSGGAGGSRTQLGIELLKSRSFISDFVERRDILPELMAVESWDAESGEIIFDPEIYDIAAKQWIHDTKPVKVAAPSAQKAHKAFAGVLTVSEDKQTGYVTVSIDHQSPFVAAQWVSWLVEDVNVAVRRQDVVEAEKSIEYLKQQIANTSLADLQVMFFELIQAQTEIVMLAEVRPEYVFKTIDPAVVPEEKSSPPRAIRTVMGALFGSVLGILWTLIGHYRQSFAISAPQVKR